MAQAATSEIISIKRAPALEERLRLREDDYCREQQLARLERQFVELSAISAKLLPFLHVWNSRKFLPEW